MEIFKKHLKHTIGFFTGIISFVVYLLTLAPTVNFIDSGELAAVAATLGIAHPTGYPLFTILGYIFAKIPFDIQIIKKLNLMAALFSALGIVLFYNFLVLLHQKITKTFVKIIKDIDIFLISSISALLLAFSRTVWSQSTSIEVYSLHIFFISLLLLIVLKSAWKIFSRDDYKEIDSKSIFFAAYVLGLSFTNHMTTILFLPALIYLLYHTIRILNITKKFILHLIIFFLFGISVYLYLPIRAFQAPIFNWGNPINLEKFFWHISGKQYRVWIFSSTESALKQLTYYITNFHNEFNLFLIIIGLLGIYLLLKNNRRLFVFLLILFITCLGYSINYDIHDIDSYFLLSYFIFGTWISIGLMNLYLKFSRQKFLVNALITVLPVIPFSLNYQYCDESNNYQVFDYMNNVFKSVNPNSIIISYQWDYFISASYYFQYVENYHKDIVIIDKELLRRSWYFEQIKKNHPEIYNKSKNEIELFLEELYKFEHNIPYNVQLIEQRYSNVIRSFIEKNYKERKIYVTPEIEDQYLIGYKKIPSGLCYQLVKDENDALIRYVDFEFREISKSSKLSELMRKMYLRASLENGIFMLKYGDRISARKYFEEGLRVDPDSKELRFYYDQLLR